MPIKKEDCKECHSYWVHPEERFYPFCSSECITQHQVWTNHKRREINDKIDKHKKEIEILEKELNKIG